jgi:Zn-dependent protease
LIYGLVLFPAGATDWLESNLANSILINVILCVFNMLPLPPLDGGRVAVGLLPDALAFPLARIERYGIVIVLLFLFVLPYAGEQIGLNLNIAGWLIGVPAEALYQFILKITGQG